MAIRKCYDCGRDVDDDEHQVVIDQMMVAVEPLAGLIDITPERFIDGLFDDGRGYCPRCFRKRDDETPLRAWAENLAQNPLEHPAMFRWHPIKKGANHVD